MIKVMETEQIRTIRTDHIVCDNECGNSVPLYEDTRHTAPVGWLRVLFRDVDGILPNADYCSELCMVAHGAKKIGARLMFETNADAIATESTCDQTAGVSGVFDVARLDEDGVLVPLDGSTIGLVFGGVIVPLFSPLGLMIVSGADGSFTVPAASVPLVTGMRDSGLPSTGEAMTTSDTGGTVSVRIGMGSSESSDGPVSDS